MSNNPYNWRAYDPDCQLPHPLRDEIRSGLLRGELFALIGGHGMGKTVLLGQLERSIPSEAAEVLLVGEKPPGRFTEIAGIEYLSDRLGLERLTNESVPMLVRRWLAAHPGRGLILLLDDIDKYVDEDTWAARDFLNALARANSESGRRLGIAVAGGIGYYKLDPARTGLGYSSRAAAKLLAPFTHEDIEALALQGSSPSAEVLDTLRLFSGGIPALVAYGLEKHWEIGRHARPADITETFAEFEEEHASFIQCVHRGVGIDSSEHGYMSALWHFLHQNPNPDGYLRQRLLAQLDEQGPSLTQLEDGFQLLRASGLIRVRGRVRANPILVESIHSILKPPYAEEPGQAKEPMEQLCNDLERVLGHIGRLSMDFFQGKDKATLAPESVFSAVLAIGMSECGWEQEREPQQGPGFVDLKLRHPRFVRMRDAIVEVKLWSNNKGRKTIHTQATGYCIDGPAEEQCAATVMVASLADAEQWKDTYISECLGDCDHEAHPVDPPITAAFRAERTSGDGAGITVTHFLLNLRRR